MNKGDQTREMILDRAAQLFNRQGYFGASLSDIMRETGLEKGGIYNHFKSKEELALEAFDYAVELVANQQRLALAGKTNSIDRLKATISVFEILVENPVLVGGCPILNTAIESDDAHPQLLERARKAMDKWFRMIQRIVNDGINTGEIRPEVDPIKLASILIALMEGAIMLTKLYDDPIHMERAVEHIIEYIETAIRA